MSQLLGKKDFDDREYPRNFYSLGADSLVVTRPQDPKAPLESSVHSWESLKRRLETEPYLPVEALIFHCSRCGSTLLNRFFEIDASNRAFAEPEALLKYLIANAQQLSAGVAGELATLVRAFGLSPRVAEKRTIIKLNSHALLYLPLFRACFPNVPFIYLLRDPVEVVASLRALPPTFLHDTERAKMAESLGVPASEVQKYSQVEWFAWYVAQNLRLALRHATEFSHVADYGDRRTRYLAIVNEISRQNRSWDDPEVTLVRGRHSKNPASAFVDTANSVDRSELAQIISPIVGDAYKLWQSHPAIGSRQRAK